MTILILFMVLLNLIFFMSSHPLSMGFCLMAQTIIIALIMCNILPSFWYSFILILVFLGGMLIIFIYVTSMASNEKFTPKTWMMIPLFLIVMIFMNLPTESFMLFKSSDNVMEKSFSFLYSMPLVMMTSFLIVYLFVVLLAVAKITKWWGGAIRSQ